MTQQKPQISFCDKTQSFSSQRAPQFSVPVLYEDNHLLVVVKPVGMLSQGDRTGEPDLLTVLKDYLVWRHQKPGEAWLGLVHRLDRPVGGVMVYAKTSKSASRLSQSIREGAFQKIYWAIAKGSLPVSGDWVDHLSEHKINGKYQVQKEGKYCHLTYQRKGLVEQPEPLSLIEITLDTGRSHQIRVQSSVRGYPLVGDRRYGEGTALDCQIQSPALWATRLSFPHPITRQEMKFTAPVPDQLPWNLFQNGLI